MEKVIFFFVFCLGLVLGSFFNVLIYRIPLKKSIIFPSSFCPLCGTPIKIWHNIPIISYLFLKGKCYSCKQPISYLYPLIELITGLALLIIWYLFLSRVPLGWNIIVPLFQSFFLLLLIPISVIDLKHYIIPDVFTIPPLVIAIILSLLQGEFTLVNSMCGILAGGGSLFVIGKIGSIFKKKDAMGGGDIKLMAAAGALFGVKSVLLSIFIGALLGSVYGIFIILKKKVNSEHQIPFGPFLSGGIWISVLWGERIIEIYQSLLL